MRLKNQIGATNARAALILTFIFSILGASLLGAAGASGNQTNNPDFNLGIPDNALQHNRTDTTPNGQMEQVRAMETNVFNYRNLTFAINCTRNCELNITADPNLNSRLLSLWIEPVKNMSLIMNMTKGAPEAEMVQTRTLNFYLGIEPNATLELKAQIRLHINQTELYQELNREVNASRLTWQYYNTTERQWVSVPSWIDENNYLVCNTTHFSIWTVTELSDQITPQPEPSATISPGSSTEPVELDTSPSPTTYPTGNAAQTNQPTETLSPSPSTSAVLPNSSNQKDIPDEYWYLGIGGVLAIAIAIVSFFAIRKRRI